MLLLTVVLVMVAMGLVMSVPAFANEGANKPFNYGDCVSGVATGLYPATLGGEEVTLQEFTDVTHPYESSGQGGQPDDIYGIHCRYHPPGSAN